MTNYSEIEGQRENQNNEKKVRRLNDFVLLTEWILTSADPQSDLEALPTDDFDLFSKRVQRGLNIKRLFQGTVFNFSSNPATEDWTWLFYGTNTDQYGVVITDFSYNGATNIYPNYKLGLDVALQNWINNGSIPKQMPAYYPLPDAATYLTRFAQMEQIATFFYSIFPAEENRVFI